MGENESIMKNQLLPEVAQDGNLKIDRSETLGFEGLCQGPALQCFFCRRFVVFAGSCEGNNLLVSGKALHMSLRLERKRIAALVLIKT